MEQISVVVHLLVALTIIGLIMLQQGKRADMGASFGAGGSQTLFGSSGSGKEMASAIPPLIGLAHQAHVGLVHERRGLQGLARLQATHARAGELAQLGVDQR